MRDADNDNSTWTSLGFQTLLVLNKLRLDSQMTEMMNASSQVNSAGLLGSRISAEVDTAVPNRDADPEATVLIDVIADTPNVASVQCPVGFTEVFEAVIISDAIYMVDHFDRPSTMNPEPSKPMGLIVNPVDTNDDIAVPSFGSGDGPRLSAISHRDQPSEQSRFPIIGEQVSQPLDRQIGMIVATHTSPSNYESNSVQTNGLGDAGPVDEVSKDDERDGGRNAERCEDRESEHPRRASAR
jgi:hypothetical protein